MQHRQAPANTHRERYINQNSDIHAGRNIAKQKRLESISNRWNQLKGKPVIAMEPKFLNPIFGKVVSVFTDHDKKIVEVKVDIFQYQKHRNPYRTDKFVIYTFSATNEYESDRVWIYELTNHRNEKEPSVYSAVLQLEPHEFYSIVMRPDEFCDYMDDYVTLKSEQNVMSDSDIEEELLAGNFIEKFCH